MFQSVIRNDNVRDAIGRLGNVRIAVNSKRSSVLAGDRIDFNTDAFAASQLLQQEAAATTKVDDCVRGLHKRTKGMSVDPCCKITAPALPGKILDTFFTQIVVGGSVFWCPVRR